jgi:hypothetical protein
MENCTHSFLTKISENSRHYKLTQRTQSNDCIWSHETKTQLIWMGVLVDWDIQESVFKWRWVWWNGKWSSERESGKLEKQGKRKKVIVFN